MVKYISGDILTPNHSSSKVLVCHQVNCQGVMGSGLARQVKIQCPEAYESYIKIVRDSDKQCLGWVDLAYIHSKNFMVANIFGQYDYGMGKQRTNYQALSCAFDTIRLCSSGYIVRFPYLMGCYRGGGAWEVVEKMILDKIARQGIDVEIWKLDRG